MTSRNPEALFLDRDGTLIEWVHYLSDPDKVVLLPGIADALKRAKNAGCLLFLHTNQSGVGRGYFGMDAVEAVNARMFELMGIEANFFDGICIATDAPDRMGEGSYRKPSSRFACEMIRKYSLTPECCYMIGDSECDVETGENAGIHSVVIIAADLDKRANLGKRATFAYGSVEDFVTGQFEDSLGHFDSRSS